MQQGTIARLNNGYGFIAQEGQDKDLFFHLSELNDVEFDSLREGDKVTFTPGEGPKGPCATDINLVEEAAA